MIVVAIHRNMSEVWTDCVRTSGLLTFWRRNYFFLILAHTVYKM